MSTFNISQDLVKDCIPRKYSGSEYDVQLNDSDSEVTFNVFKSGELIDVISRPPEALIRDDGYIKDMNNTIAGFRNESNFVKKIGIIVIGTLLVSMISTMGVIIFIMK